jgi:hypothetical protein
VMSSFGSAEVWRAEREERIEMYPLELKIRLCPSKHTFVLAVIIIMVRFVHHGPRVLGDLRDARPGHGLCGDGEHGLPG